jgi:O-antigen/teichoic acid export membrane protein
LGFGGGQAIRFVGNLILTRLLFAEAFGVMALVWSFLQGLALFSDIGVGPSIIQNKRGNQVPFLNTAWTIQVGRGVLLWVVACVGAGPFAQLFGEPLLAEVLPVAALAALFYGFFSTKLFTMNRQLTVGRLALIEITSQILGLVVMVLWAWLDRTVWALVVGGLSSSFIKLLLSHWALPGPANRFHWNGEMARELFRFGRWIFFSTAFTFLASQADRLIFGAMIPLAVLGVYHIAVTLATLPVVALEQLGNKVIFPFLSRQQRNGDDLPNQFRRIRWPLLVAGGWILSGFVAGGTTIVDVLYDERYAAAGWIVQVLSVGSWPCVLYSTYKSALLARGNARIVAAASLAKVVAMVTLIPLGFHLFAFPGAVVGLMASELFRFGLCFGASLRMGISGWKQDLVLTVVLFLASGMGYAVDAAVLAEASLIWRVLAVFLIVSALWTPLAVVALKQWRR